MSKPFSIQEALIYVMVITSASDGLMTDNELATIGDVTRMLPVFDGFDPANVLPAAQRCTQLLQAEDGMNDVLTIIAETLPHLLYDTAYALAVEVAASDIAVSKEEMRILQILRDRFRLDKLTCAAIERGAIARYRLAG